jgi:N-acetylglucosaminyl-diphospho-decaprenol L-rhamnosyltransferase
LTLDVVIVTYRSRDLVRRCLGSLFEHPAAVPMRVFVVDNASNDGTDDLVRLEFPAVDMEISTRNLGFSAANNRAIRRGSGAYVLALNPDTCMTEGALDALVALMERHPEVGICGCRLVQENGEFDHASRRAFPTIVGALGHFSGLGRRTERGGLAQYRAPNVEGGPVDAVNGAFMLMRRSALEEVGLFDEGFWMYMEDLDLCYRFRQAGWTTWYEPSVSVMHVKAGTSGKLRQPRLNYAFHYGMFRFYRKHYAADANPAVNVSVYAGIALKLALSIVSTESRRVLALAPRGASPED